MCFIPSECFKATTSGFSHQQLVSEPRSSENRSVLGDIRIFQSCQKQVLIIPPCRAHPYELTDARISFIGDGGSLHAPPESSVTVAQSHPRALEEEDECRPREPYLSRVSRYPAEPIFSCSRADRIFHRIFPVQPREPDQLRSTYGERLYFLLEELSSNN